MTARGLCIGIDEYPSTSSLLLPRLQGAVADSEAFHSWLTKHAGLSDSQCTLLRNDQATSHAIESWLKEQWTTRTGEGCLWIFLAGHGAGVQVDYAGYEPVLFTADANLDEDWPAHVAPRPWARLFHDSGAFERVVLVTDFCRRHYGKLALRRPPRAHAILRGKQPQRFFAFGSQHGDPTREKADDNGQVRGNFSRIVEHTLSGPPPIYAFALERAIREKVEHSALPELDVSRERDFLIVGADAQRQPAEPAAHNGTQTRAVLGPWYCDVEATLGPHEAPRGGLGGLQIPILACARIQTCIAGHSETRLVAEGAAHVKLTAPPPPDLSPPDPVVQTLLDGRVRVTAQRGTLTSATQAPGRPAELRIGQYTLHVPLPAAWRLTVRIPPAPYPPLLRLSSPGRSELDDPTENARTWLSLALSTNLTPLPPHVESLPEPDELGHDPILLLLLVTWLQARHGSRDLWSPFLDALARALPEARVDVALLRLDGPVRADSPALMQGPWRRALAEQRITTTGESAKVAFSTTPGPWLGAISPSLATLGFALQPGPDIEGVGEREGQGQVGRGVAWAAHVLGQTPESVMHLPYKSPPMDRLVQHDRLAFVGASNHQLPHALALAFLQRGRKWGEVHVFMLEDNALKQITSSRPDGSIRTPEELMWARDMAEKNLGLLMPRIAERWRLVRHDGWRVTPPELNAPILVFGSLWDWERAGGLIHISPCSRDTDVGRAAFINLEWNEGQEPPEQWDWWSRAYQMLIPGPENGFSQE